MEKNIHVNQFLFSFSFSFSFLCCAVLGVASLFFIFHFLSFIFLFLSWAGVAFFFYLPPPPHPFNGFPRRCLLFFLFFSFFFLCLTRHDFYFLMNWLIYFGCLSFICFNWPSFFNKGIWVNLDKLTFFIPPLFHFQSNKEERN